MDPNLAALLFIAGVAGVAGLVVFIGRSYLLYRLKLEHERTRKEAILMLCVKYLQSISKLPAGAERDAEIDDLVRWLKTKPYWEMYALHE